jgi:hypothetical protein
LAAGLSGCSAPTSAVTTKPPSAPAAAPSVATADMWSGQWVEVALNSGETYFGHAAERADGSLLLWDVYYPGGADGTRTVLTRLGTEIHKPQRYMVVEAPAVVSWQALTPDSPVLAAIQASGDPMAAAPAADAIASQGTYAVFLKDGRVLFGGMREGQAGWIGLTSPYYLVRKGGSITSTAPIKSLSDLQLVAEVDSRIGRDKTLWVSADSVRLYEPLDTGSPVLKAIASAKK